MRCSSCQHTNPSGSRYCNQCGTRLDAPEAPARPKPARMALPGSAQGQLVAIEPILYGSESAANAALVAVGAAVQPRLQCTLEVPGLGRITRCFGVLSNGIGDDEATEERTEANVPLGLLHFSNADLDTLQKVQEGMLQRADRTLKVPDNDRVRRKLDEGKLKYLPVNKLLSRRLEHELVSVGMHLPWSVGGFDTAFGTLCRNALQGFGFVCYFGYLGRFEDHDGAAAFRLGRHTSIPFGVDGMHTWEPPISDDIIDEDCGLLIEANAWPEAQ